MLRSRFYDPDLLLDDLMKTWPETIPVFFRHKMLCVGCLITPFHTVQDACTEYGLNIDAFYQELAEALSTPPFIQKV